MKKCNRPFENKMERDLIKKKKKRKSFRFRFRFRERERERESYNQGQPIVIPRRLVLCRNFLKAGPNIPIFKVGHIIIHKGTPMFTITKGGPTFQFLKSWAPCCNF